MGLHGFTGCGSDFEPFAQLCGNHWSHPDLPGHGTTGSSDCSPDAVRQFVEEQAAQLSEHPKVLLGYSMGSRAALLHATAYPDAWDAVILISANPGIEDRAERNERRRVDEKLANRIERDGASSFIDFWQSTPMIRSQQNIRSDWRDAMQAYRLRHTTKGLATSLRQFGQGSCPNLWDQLSQISCPVLLITGALDNKYCAISKRMQSELARADHVVIPDVGHMPHLEDAEGAIANIQPFLRAVL